MSTSVADRDFISPAAKEAFDLLNAGAKSVWRGQGDTWTAARDRAAKDAGLKPSQAERLQKNWRTMKYPNGDVYRLLRNRYEHLCDWFENRAAAIERETQEIEAGNAPMERNQASLAGVVAPTKRAQETQGREG